MARIKPQEILRRVAVPSRQAEAPILAVQADQAPASAAGALSRAAAGVLGRVGQLSGEHRKINDAIDSGNASLQRQQEDATGAPRLTEEAIREHSEAWRRGYLKADGVLAIRDWKIEAAQVLAKAEPGEDIEPILNERMAQLLERPEFQDAQVRQVLIPMAQGAAQQLRELHLKQSMQESLTRQQESLTAIARDMIVSGELLTNEGRERFYGMLNTEDFAYVDRRGADAVFVAAAVEALSSGDVDPKKVIDFLEQATDENGVTLMDGQHGQALRAAAAAGQNVIDRRLDRARDVAMAQMEFKLQGLAERGLLYDHVIVDSMTKAGVTPESDPNKYTQTLRYWQNQQEATLRKWEQERKEREKNAKERELLFVNPYMLTDDQVRKQLDAMIIDSKPEERGSILRLAYRAGVVPTYFKNAMRRPDYTDPKSLREAYEVYTQMKKLSPAFALEGAGAEAAARFEDVYRDVTMGGQSFEVAANRFAKPKVDQEEAAFIINRAWKDGSKEHAKDHDGNKRSAQDMFRIRRRAEQLVLSVPGLSGEAAIHAAVGEFDAQHTTVNGRRVPNRAMPKGGEAATEVLADSVAKRLGRDPKSLSARPVEGPDGNWVLIDNESGFPITDPDTGHRVVFDPRAVAAIHESWTADRAEAKARRLQLYRTTPWKHQAPPVARLGSPEAEAFRAARDAIPEIPEDFLDYLNRKQ